jgi:hypothetical protein
MMENPVDHDTLMFLVILTGLQCSGLLRPCTRTIRKLQLPVTAPSCLIKALRSTALCYLIVVEVMY